MLLVLGGFTYLLNALSIPLPVLPLPPEWAAPQFLPPWDPIPPARSMA